MSLSDAFVVGEDWISEHYFSTEATNESFLKRVIDRRKAWDSSASETTLGRFTRERTELLNQLGRLDPREGQVQVPSVAVAELYDDILAMLGYSTAGLQLKADGPLTWVRTPGVEGGAPLVIVQARPAADIEDLLEKDGPTLLEPYTPEGLSDSEQIRSVARVLSHVFVQADGPKLGLVLAGRWCLVVEAERWLEGRYLAVDLQLVCERNQTKRGGEIDRALTCLDVESLAPDAAGDQWWLSTLEESVKHTVGVSKDLREGVRLSIEIIANEVVRRRAAQDLAPLAPDQAQPLATQSLRYLYRILFLLYAEASPELGVLPVGASEYDQGYSLDRLRELTLVQLHGAKSLQGTHFYESLDTLFRLVEVGHDGSGEAATQGSDAQEGLTFNPLRADLFRPSAIALIAMSGLGNAALQRVLRHLLLSKESKKRNRGFISYVELGINQLGAVYEGLMSYTGFFATEDLFEVAKNGDPEKGSWVVPVGRVEHLSKDDFVRIEDELTGEMAPVRHAKGTCVFRLSGRDRQQSASYYSPEVLTRFTVSQALAELLDQDGQVTSAEQILQLSICEPALGSGAFAIEAVRQLATQYLTRRQDELGERVDPDSYPSELQRVKAHIALHQVYGVDLNATAVELAEVSLWLDTMVAGLQAPWFGLRLRRGNSLIGARREFYTRDQVLDKAWLKTAPEPVAMTGLAQNMEQQKTFGEASGRIHHFLLPAAGWASTVEVPKDVRALADDQVKALKKWRTQVTGRPTTTQVKRLQGLADRVETLWQISLRRLRIAEAESSRSISLWGKDAQAAPHAVTREQIEKSLADEGSAYRRLRLVMDLWCALWFWPLTETDVTPPSRDEWLDALSGLLGMEVPISRNKAWMDTFSAAETWELLGEAEHNDRVYAQAKPVAGIREQHPWIAVCEQVAARQGFFHWELDFASAFARGGFDLQVGNPPWVRPDVDIDALLAEGDPWWQLVSKASEGERDSRWDSTLERDGVRQLVLEGTAETVAVREFVSNSATYPLVDGLRPDLYRCFMEATWARESGRGVVALIHPETHFTDERAASLRSATYERLRRHWQFVNELKLFEIDHHVTFGVHIYGHPAEPRFQQATSLYLPETVERSMRHDGSGPEPGFKDSDGKWDTRAHASRIQSIDKTVLGVWRDVLESPATPPQQTRMLYTVNTAVAQTLASVATATRIGGLGLESSVGWDEKAGRQKGRFVSQWGLAQWEDAILQGPHLHVSTPLYKVPNVTMRNNLDWTSTDFESLPVDALPVTAYKRVGDRATYDAAYNHWQIDGKSIAARDCYRVAWRAMAANTGERTLISAVIPPGAGHINGVFCVGAPKAAIQIVPIVAGVTATLLSDFAVRAAPKSAISPGVLERLPMVDVTHPLIGRSSFARCG